MKVVYCLSGGAGDAVVAMMRLSIASVRLTNPDTVVEVLIDQQSLEEIQAAGSRLLEEIDHVHACAVPPGPAALRSRHLKTSMRTVVQGAFLFLDADTLVRKPLCPEWSDTTDVAACPNYCRDRLHEQLEADEAAYIAAMGWPLPSSYVNSGVVFFADSPQAHAVGRLWHACWTAGVRRTGRRIDQPAFNHAVQTSGAELCLLPSGWNSQIVRAPATARDASIWHYYHSCERAADTRFAIEALRLSHDQPVEQSVVRRLVSADLPWPTDSWIRRTVVGMMIRQGEMAPLMSSVLAGEYVKAARHMSRAALERLVRPFNGVDRRTQR